MASINIDLSSDTWRCEECDVTFSDLYLCISHNLEIHKTSGILICNYCHYISFNTSDINEHMQLHPSTSQTVTAQMISCIKIPWSITERWSCEECNIPFSDIDSYISHNVHVHIKSGVLNCKFNCGVMSYSKSYIEQHMTFEHPEQTYYCLICERHIFTMSDWNKHNEEEHTAHVSHSLFTCNECNPVKHFIHFKELRKHIREEHRTQCYICNKRIKKEELKEHMNTHSLVYPFQCNECGSRYGTLQGLHRHYTLAGHVESSD